MLVAIFCHGFESSAGPVRSLGVSSLHRAGTKIASIFRVMRHSIKAYFFIVFAIFCFGLTAEAQFQEESFELAASIMEAVSLQEQLQGKNSQSRKLKLRYKAEMEHIEGLSMDVLSRSASVEEYLSYLSFSLSVVTNSDTGDALLRSPKIYNKIQKDFAKRVGYLFSKEPSRKRVKALFDFYRNNTILVSPLPST